MAMDSLAIMPETFFIGYNINYDTRVYGTLKDIPQNKCLEMPLAENLMTGTAIGMCLEGYRPILIFERHDFMLNAFDALINHLDKMSQLSQGQFTPQVIIRAIVGSNKPLDPGPQHTQDFTKFFQEYLSFPVYNLKNSQEVIRRYKEIQNYRAPVMLIERRELYDKE